MNRLKSLTPEDIEVLVNLVKMADAMASITQSVEGKRRLRGLAHRLGRLNMENQNK